MAGVSNNSFKVGIVDETNDRQTGDISVHSEGVRDVIANSSQGRAERVYYNPFNNGNPPPYYEIGQADSGTIKQAIGQSVVGICNSAADALKTFEKNHPDMKACAIPFGANTARLVKEVAKNPNLGLSQDFQAANALVKEAMAEHQPEIDKAQTYWKDTAKNSKIATFVSAGNERQDVNGADPQFQENILLNKHVAGVAATDDNATVAEYSSQGDNIRYAASGESGFNDRNGQNFRGTSISAPKVATAAAQLMTDKKLNKDQVFKYLDKRTQEATLPAEDATQNAETGLSQENLSLAKELGISPEALAEAFGDGGSGTELTTATKRDVGKGFLEVA
jgi:Subtilase family